MSRFFRKVSQKIGLEPGSLVYTNEKKVQNVKITIMDYDDKNVLEKEVKTIEECLPFKKSSTVTWINIDGLHDIEIIEAIGEYFGLHHLVLEDILNTNQRPKYEDYDDYIFIVLKMLTYDENEEEIIAEQVSIILGSHFVISFQEKEGDVFDFTRNRIRSDKYRIRKMGADYLAYSLLDAIIDNYFIILEKIGEQIELMEDLLIKDPSPTTLNIIHHSKKEIIFLRKSVWPIREVINVMDRRESPLIEETTGAYIRDLYDHTVQIIDSIETFRDLVSGMLDIYLSSISNKMNNIMKVLTIIATIFIPLTFITGIYGMNFKFIPELDWRWGYPAVWLIMLIVMVSMIFYFKNKDWL